MESDLQTSFSLDLRKIRRKTWRYTLSPWICGLITVLLTLGHRLINIPLNRLFEDNLCRRYYVEHNPSLIGHDGSIDETLCKETRIQQELAFYINLIVTLELVCELSSSVPLGFISDKYGRRLVLFGNTIAAVVAISWYIAVGHFYNTFPFPVIIAAPFLFLSFGGINVAGAMLNAICADVADGESQVVKIFSYTQSGSQVIQLLAPALSSATMTRSIWIPFWLGLACIALVLPQVALLPETRGARSGGLLKSKTSRSTSPDTEPLITEETHSGVNEASSSNERLNADPEYELGNFIQALRRSAKSMEAQIRDLKRLVTSSRSYGLTLVIFLVTTLARSSLNILLQYVSKRYHKTFAQAGYTISIKAGVNLVLFTAIIPAFLNITAKRYNYAESAANLLGLRVSLMVLLVGVLLISISFEFWALVVSLCVYSLGYGLNVFALGLLTHLTTSTMGESHLARSYSNVAFVETLGSLIGVPIIAAIWIAALGIGGLGLGVPWWFCATLYLSVAVATWFIVI